jgi:hypothetical protein
MKLLFVDSIRIKNEINVYIITANIFTKRNNFLLCIMQIKNNYQRFVMKINVQ